MSARPASSRASAAEPSVVRIRRVMFISEYSGARRDKFDASSVKPALNALMRISLRRNQSAVRWVPAPEEVVNQFGAAPPAVDRVVAAEIFRSRQDSFAQRGELPLAFLVSPETIAFIVHLQREWSLFEARHAGGPANCAPLSRSTALPPSPHTPQ